MENIIEIRNLTKSFGGKPVVDRLNLSVPKGAIFALLGENGGWQDHDHSHVDRFAARRLRLGDNSGGRLLEGRDQPAPTGCLRSRTAPFLRLDDGR